MKREFMFQLTVEERNQLVTICHRFKTMKHSSSLPYVFTELERKIERHDEEIKVVFDAIRQLMAQPEPKEKKIVFHVRERGARYRTSRRRDTT